MKNIYDFVGEFYETLPHETAAIIKKEVVEKYFRTEIWRRVDESILLEQWNAIRILLQNLSKWEYEDFFYVSPSDYQEIFFQYAEEFKLPMRESSVKKFFSLIHPMFHFYLKNEKREEIKFYEGTLSEGRHSFYLYGKFSMPRRRPSDSDFYIEMEHDSNLSQDITDELNRTIDSLLYRIKRLFNSKPHMNDLNRAFGIFYGAIIQDDEEQIENDKQRGFVNFWDFFIFDYHTIKDDETPIYFFYKHERKNLTYSEDQILRDLMGTHFKIFFIEDQDEDRSTCRDLLTNEIFELPPSPTDSPDIYRMVFIGHIRAEGVMLLDHVVGFSASQKLRERMRQEIFRAFELFKYQKPKARLQDFLNREAAMIRHILRVLSEFAQLNIVPLRDFPKPIQVSNEKIPPAMKDSAKRLKIIGKSLGISEYGLHLLLKLYSDFIFIFPATDQQKQSDASLLAVLYLFYRANDLPLQSLDSLTRDVRQLRDFSMKLMNLANSALDIVTFDPRYSIEDGFVCMLFWEDAK